MNAAIVERAIPAGRGAGREALSPAGDGRRTLHRTIYRLWRILPAGVQRLAVRLAVPAVTVGACAIIQDARGRVLLARHTYRRQPWDLPGGFVRGDEQPPEALARELGEELGAGVSVGPLIFAHTDEPARHLTLYYRAGLAGPPRPDGVEIDDYRYVAAEELPALLGSSPPAWLGAVAAARAA
jgi:ADP-ribose pyrophosphatase YjhB (NUDIX family)